jgi:hypothetical protein
VIVLFGVETNVRGLKARDNKTMKVLDTRKVLSVLWRLFLVGTEVR